MTPLNFAFQGRMSAHMLHALNFVVNLVHKIEAELCGNFIHILVMARRHLLLFKIKGQRTRSYGKHCCKTFET